MHFSISLHGERMTEFSFTGEPTLSYGEHDLLAALKQAEYKNRHLGP